ncbi:hypothetical protein EniLVp02_0247 [Vibrio phage EniLVp02]
MCIRRKVTTAVIALAIAAFPWGALASDNIIEPVTYNDYVERFAVTQLCGNYGYLPASEAYTLERKYHAQGLGEFDNVPRERLRADITNVRAGIGFGLNTDTNLYYTRVWLKDTCQKLK